MSNLGGNSPSADTDKSNNLVGPPGADSTVPGPEGPVSTTPGPQGDTPYIESNNWFIDGTDTGIQALGSNGTDGVMASVVAGAGISVNSADPANPIVTASTPLTTKGDFIIRNGSGADVRIAAGANGEVIIADSTLSLGVKWGKAVTTLDISAFIQGAPTDAEKLATFVATQAFTLPTALAASAAYAEVVSTAAATIDVQVNAVSKGTINFALGAATATFTFASPVVIAAGDRIQFIAQGTADDTLADISFTIRGDI